MKIALLADIHGNLEALQACLAHARRQGAARLAFLGDMVGYNADPLACLEIVRAETERGALAVRGNHDAAVLGGLLEDMNLPAREAMYWTREQLGAEARAWIANLPLVSSAGEATWVHASPDAPQDWTYITGSRTAARGIAASPTRLVFSGHVHDGALYYSTAENEVRRFRPEPGVAVPLLAARRWLCIAGAVGQPRDGSTAASYAIYDDAPAGFTLFRVPYDYAAAARKLRAAGLPERLARRLETGR